MERELVFYNKHARLTGTLTTPEPPGVFPAMVITHTSHAPTRDFHIYRHAADRLPAQGIAVFRYDRRGSGESEGDFTTASFFDLADDLLAAVAALKQHAVIDSARIGVWGMSQGGWIAPLAAARSADIAFVVAVSSVGVTPAEQMAYSAAYVLKEKGFSEENVRQMLALASQVNAYYRGDAGYEDVQTALNDHRAKPWFEFSYLDEVLPPDPKQEKWALEMDFDPLPVYRKVTVPVLLLYGEQDPWVPISQSIAAWQEHGPADQAVHQINGANHFMLSIAQAGLNGDEGPVVEAYTKHMVEWLKQQVG
ncbi:MAG TPA: alpha/beta hydrolase [Anaerolineales bacterium]|nr:alpha/beta hydrolase [Anaerolineales bacterium]